MTISVGYPQLQPKFILGTDQWISEAAEQMVGSQIDTLNQLREHFPFYSLAKGRTVVRPTVATLTTADFVGASPDPIKAPLTVLTDPPEEFDLTSLVATIDLTNYPIAVQSWSIDQLALHIEFVKIALRILYWTQFFLPAFPNGFRGLPDLVTADQTIASGRRLDLADMDDLVDAVTEGDGEMDNKVIVMHPRAFVTYVRAVRATGASLEYGMRGTHRYAVHGGVPLLMSGYVALNPIDPTTATSDVWCFTLGIGDKGVYGVVPPDVGDNGLVVEPVQGRLDADTRVVRARWFTTVVLGGPRGLARLADVRVDGSRLA